MLTKNNSTIQKCIKSKVHSECPPSWSLTCLLFRVTTVNTLEHILPDFFPKGHSYLLYGCLGLFFFFFFITWITQGIFPWNLLASFFS